MPLHDHFRPPVEARAPWSSVCTYWVTFLGQWLNATLPPDRYQSLATTHLGVAAEADLSTFELSSHDPPTPAGHGPGGLALMEAPTAMVSFETAIPDEFAVRVHDVREDMRLVGAVEFISPANKDRAGERARFVSKCLGYLSHGIGLVLVDIVTGRTANLNNELMVLLGGPPAGIMADIHTYVVGYRATPRYERFRLESWPDAVRVGSPIPTAPLVLKNGPTVMLDLEKTYQQAAAEHRLS